MGKFFVWRNVALFGVGAALFISSCAKVDNTTGNSLIPNHQQMKIARMTLAGIEAYQARVDTFMVGSQRIPFGVIGSMKSDTFGITSGGWMTQFVSSSFVWGNTTDDENTTFGENPVADSLILYLSLANYYSTGDTSKRQTFNIYRVTKRYNYSDTIYLSSNNAEVDAMVAGFIDPEPISSFEYTPYADTIRHRLTGPKADELMQLLLDITEEHYLNDSTFVDHFYGLYIAPQAGSPEDAATLAVDMTSSYLSFHTHHIIDPSVDPDSDTVVYAKYTPNMTAAYLAAFNVYKHDYTGTPLDPAVNRTINDFNNPISVGYIQGAGGPTVTLNFTSAFVDSLKLKVIYGDDIPAVRNPELEHPENKAKWEYRTMAIHGAKLSFSIHNPNNDSKVLDRAFTRLGMYYYYPNLEPSPDYLFVDELDTSVSITLPYGGYLSRTRGCYDMDISRLVQNIVTESVSYEDIVERAVMLAPSYAFDLYGQLEAVVEFDNLSVVITYTLLR